AGVGPLDGVDRERADGVDAQRVDVGRRGLRDRRHLGSILMNGRRLARTDRVDSATVSSSNAEREKRAAAEAAAELVEDGMAVGLGTGSTVALLLPALAKRSLDIVCAATSPRTEHAARELGLRIEDVASIDRFDITIDGADQIAPDGWLVKGGGGAHTREKVV